MPNQQQAVIDDPSTISPSSVPRGQVITPAPIVGPVRGSLPAQAPQSSAPSYQVPDPAMQASPVAPPSQLDAAPTYQPPPMPDKGFYAEDLTNIGAREQWAPEIEQNLQAARWQGMNDYRNSGLAIREQNAQREQEALLQREKDHQDKLDAEQRNTAAESDFLTRGIQYKKMPDGSVQPIMDEKGNPLYKPISENDAKKNGVQYDDDKGSATGIPGRAYLVTRDTAGNETPIDPDRNVKPEAWTDDRGAPWLIKKNQYNAWEYIDPNQAIDDPKMQQPAAKALWSAASAKADNAMADSKSALDDSREALDPDKLGINEKVLNASPENQLGALTPALKTAQATIDAGPPKPAPPVFLGMGGGQIDPEAMQAFNDAKQQVSMLTPHLQNLQAYITAKNAAKALKEGGPNAYLQDYLQKKKSLADNTNLTGSAPAQTTAQNQPNSDTAVASGLATSPSTLHPDDPNSIEGLITGKYGKQAPPPSLGQRIYDNTIGAFVDAFKQGDKDLTFAHDYPTKDAQIDQLEKLYQNPSAQPQQRSNWASFPARFAGGMASDAGYVGASALAGAGVGALAGGLGGAETGPGAGITALGGAGIGAAHGSRIGFGVAEGLKAKAQTLAQGYMAFRKQGLDPDQAYSKALTVANLSGALTGAVNTFAPGVSKVTRFGSPLASAALKGASEAMIFGGANVGAEAVTQIAQKRAGEELDPEQQKKDLWNAATSGAGVAAGMHIIHGALGAAGNAYLNRKIGQDVTEKGMNSNFVQKAANQFEALDASKLTPEKIAQAKAALLEPLNAANRPVVEDQINNALAARKEIAQSQAAAIAHLPPANSKLASLTDAQLNARVNSAPHPDDPIQTTPQEVQAELQRRSDVRDALAKNAPVVDAIVENAHRRSEMTRTAGQTPDGRALLDGVNRANAVRPSGTPKIDLDTAQLASDISPKTEPDSNIQPHTLGYVPLAHEVETIPDPKDRDFATSALKILNNREIDPTAEKALIGSEGSGGGNKELPTHYGASGMPLARTNEAGKIVLTDEGLDKLRQLVPSSRAMLQKDGMPVTSQHLAEQGGKLDEKSQPKPDKKLSAKAGGSRKAGLPADRVPHLAHLPDDLLATRLQNLQKGRERLQKSIDAQTKATGNAPEALLNHAAGHDRNIAEHEQEIEARKQQHETAKEAAQKQVEPKSDVSPSDRYWTATGDMGTEVRVPAENHPDKASAAQALRAKLKPGELLHDSDVYPPEAPEHAETQKTASTPESSRVQPAGEPKVTEPVSAEQKPVPESSEAPEHIAYDEHGVKEATTQHVKRAAINLTTSLDNLNLGRGLSGDRAVKINMVDDPKTVLRTTIGRDGKISVEVNAENAQKEAETFRRKRDGGDPRRWLKDALDEELKHVADMLAAREKWEAQGRKGSASEFWQKERRENLQDIKREIVAGNKAVARAFVQSFHNYANIGKAISDEDFAKKTGDVSDENALETASKLIEHLEGSTDNLDVQAVSEFIRQMLQAKNDGTLTETGYRAVVGKLLEWMKSVYANLQEAAHGSAEINHILKPIEELLKVAENPEHQAFKPMTDEEIKAKEDAEKEAKEALPKNLMVHAKEIAREIGIKPGDYDATELKEGLNKGHLLGLLRKNGMSMDQFRQALNERGFNFETPNDAVQALIHKPETLPEHESGGLKVGARPLNDIRTDREAELTPEQLREEYKARVNQIKASLWDTGTKGARLKRAGMEFAAKMRFATGNLTDIERFNKAKYEASNYQGKPVSFEGREATVVGPVFGKTRIKFADGTTKLVANDEIEGEEKAVHAGVNREEPLKISLPKRDTPAETKPIEQNRDVYAKPEPSDNAIRLPKKIASYIGDQETVKGKIPLYNLTEDIEGHPKGSTVTAETLKKAGYEAPESKGLNAGANQTETPEFKNWFGHSKVVDKNGRPAVVYHGTDKAFDEFDMSKSGANSRAFPQGDKVGFFFTSDKSFADSYGDKTKNIYLSLENPKTMTKDQFEKALNTLGGEKLRENLTNSGFDGIRLLAKGDKLGRFDVSSPENYVAFRPEQIKSSTDNVGTFDTNEKNILKAGSSEIDPNDYEKLLSELQQGMPAQSDIDALRDRALAEPMGEKTVGVPRKANPAYHEEDRRSIDAIKHIREEALPNEVQHRDDVEKEVYSRIEKEGVEPIKKELLQKALHPDHFGNYTTHDVIAGKILTPQLMSEAYRTGDEATKREAATICYATDMGLGNVARALSAAYDPFKSPAQRHIEYLTKVMTTPDSGEREAINQAPTQSERNSRLRIAQNERLKRIEKALAEMGIKPEDIFAGEARVSLKSAKFVQDAIAKGEDSRTKQAMRMFADKAPMEVIRQQTGLTREQVQAARDKFDAEIRAKVEAMVRGRGFKAADFERLDPAQLKAGAAEPHVSGSRMTKAEEDAEIEKVMQMIRGDYKDADAGKYVKSRKTGPKSKVPEQADYDKRQPFDWKKFDAGNKEQVVRAARFMQAAMGNKWEMVHEYWQNSILSGPQTHVAISIGQAANAMHEFVFKRPIEAALNAIIKDPNSPQMGELKYLYQGMMPGIARGWSQAMRTWRTENDFTKTDMLNGQMEIHGGDFQGSGHIGVIPGKLGRVIRIPCRVIMALDSFNKNLAGMMAVGAEAYRLGKAKGLEGDEMAKHIDNEIKQPGSQSWQRAYDIAANQVGFHGELPKFMSDIMKYRDLRGQHTLVQKMARMATAMLFPFVKVPYNLTRIGLRKSPLGILNVGGHIMNGAYSMAQGKPFVEGYSKAQAISDASEQFLAWGATALLASAVEGDSDDDKKNLLITAPRYYGVNKPGDVAALDREYGGPTMIRIGGRNGIYINYGKFEPLASVLGTIATTVRGLKDQPKNFMPDMMGGVVGQLKGNSFVQGMSTILDTIDAAAKGETDGLGARWAEQFLQGFVPNIFRQPIRNIDDAVRDSKFAGPGYVMTQNPAFVNQAIDLYGKPETKTGIAPLRVLFQSGVTPSPQLELGDKFLTNYNKIAEKNYWPDRPTTAQYSLEIGGKKVQMTANQATAFDRIAGQLFKQKISGWLTPDVANHPTEEYKKRFEEDLSEARKIAKQRIQSTALTR